MNPSQWQMPEFEPMEPRLLMSNTPVLGGQFDAAPTVSVVAAGTVSENGTIAAPGDTVMYEFTTKARGRISVSMEGLSGDVDPYLQMFSASERRVGANDNSGRDTTDSLIRRLVRAGQTYYILASAGEDTAGDFELKITSDPIDEYGNSAAEARRMRTRRNGSSAARGWINYAGDDDYLTFTATVTGTARVRMYFPGRTNSLSGVLSAYDQAEGLLASQAASGDGPMDLEFSVVQGQTYYLKAAGQNDTTGRYYLRMSSILAQEFVDAQEVVIPGESQQTVSGSLALDGTMTYEFTATATGYFHLDMTGANGSGIDSYIEVFNTAQRRVARNDNLNRQTVDSRVRMRVREGQTYYVRVSAAGETSGDYELTFTGNPTDDFGNEMLAAAAMRIARNGASRARGRVNYAGDVDCLEYTARDSGTVRIQMSNVGRNNLLSGALSVYDSGNNLVVSGLADGADSLSLSFSAVQGQSYYLVAAGQNDTTGRYGITIQPMLLQEFLDAEAVSVPVYGEQVETGTLGEDGSKTYKFTAANNGYFWLDMKADNGSGVDSYVEVFNSGQRRIAANNNGGDGHDSRVRVRVKAGQTYFVRCSAVNGTQGDFETTFTSRPYDEAGNDIDHAKFLSIGSAGSRRAYGSVNYAGDIDVLRITAAVTGEMQVSMAGYGRASNVTPELWAEDSEGAQLAADQTGDGSAVITFDVTAGQTYYIGAESLDQNVGRYVLNLVSTAEAPPAPAPDPEPDPDPDPQPAPPPSQDPTPGQFTMGWVSQSGGVTRLIVAGTNGNDVITLSVSGSQTTLTAAGASQVFAGVYDNIAIYGFAGNDVIRTDYSILGASLIYAGDGDDSVYDNSQGAASIYGGLGDDLLVSVGGGADSLRGEGGTDSYWVDSGDFLGDASSAEYSATNVHRINSFYQPYTTNSSLPDYVSMDVDGQNFRDPTATSYGRAWVNFADRPLFVDGPEYNDITQGSVGDCYYLAALSSMADTDPNIVRQMVTSLGDGTYAVRFYRNSQEVYLRLDADLPVYSGTSLSYAKLSPDGEIWVAMLEKAYAHFRYDQNTYASISGGWMSTVYREMTNRSTTTRWSGGDAGDLANFIKSSLDNGHAATLGSYGSSPSPIVGSHAYVIKSIEGSGASAIVTVYNPWGVDGRSYDSNYGDGLLRLNMTQMQACFSAVVTSSA